MIFAILRALHGGECLVLDLVPTISGFCPVGYDAFTFVFFAMITKQSDRWLLRISVWVCLILEERAGFDPFSSLGSHGSSTERQANLTFTLLAG